MKKKNDGSDPAISAYSSTSSSYLAARPLGCYFNSGCVYSRTRLSPPAAHSSLLACSHVLYFAAHLGRYNYLSRVSRQLIKS